MVRLRPFLSFEVGVVLLVAAAVALAADAANKIASDSLHWSEEEDDETLLALRDWQVACRHGCRNTAATLAATAMVVMAGRWSMIQDPDAGHRIFIS